MIEMRSKNKALSLADSQEEEYAMSESEETVKSMNVVDPRELPDFSKMLELERKKGTILKWSKAPRVSKIQKRLLDHQEGLWSSGLCSLLSLAALVIANEILRVTATATVAAKLTVRVLMSV